MTRISDKPIKLSAPYAHAVIMPTVSQAELEAGDSKVNGGLFGCIKSFGSCVLVSDLLTVDKTGHALMMAEGREHDSLWTSLCHAKDVTPSTINQPASPFLTDRKPKMSKYVLGSKDFPVIDEADVADGDSFINDRRTGGKKLGAAIVMKKADGSFHLLLAADSNPSGKWYFNDGTSITPDAPTVATAPFDKKPKVLSGAVAAVPFPVIELDKLSALSHSINSGDGTVNGKQEGSFVVLFDLGVPKLYVASGKEPADKWVTLAGDDTVGAITPS